jgi:hypothetical protein
VDAPEVDVPDETLAAAPLVEDLDRAAILEDGDPRLGRCGVDEEFPTHGV